MSAVSVKFALTGTCLLHRRRLGHDVSSVTAGRILVSASGPEGAPDTTGISSVSAPGPEGAPDTTGISSVSAPGPYVSALTGRYPRYRIPAGLTFSLSFMEPVQPAWFVQAKAASISGSSKRDEHFS